MDHLRALLLLAADARSEWNAMGVAGKLYIPPAQAAEVLAGLAAKKLLIARGQPMSYRYQPQTPELGELVKELAELDRQRPVTLINLVYARPGALQAFADAFKIKKDN